MTSQRALFRASDWSRPHSAHETARLPYLARATLSTSHHNSPYSLFVKAIRIHSYPREYGSSPRSSSPSFGCAHDLPHAHRFSSIHHGSQVIVPSDSSVPDATAPANTCGSCHHVLSCAPVKRSTFGPLADFAPRESNTPCVALSSITSSPGQSSYPSGDSTSSSRRGDLRPSFTTSTTFVRGSGISPTPRERRRIDYTSRSRPSITSNLRAWASLRPHPPHPCKRSIDHFTSELSTPPFDEGSSSDGESSKSGMSS